MMERPSPESLYSAAAAGDTKQITNIAETMRFTTLELKMICNLLPIYPFVCF